MSVDRDVDLGPAATVDLVATAPDGARLIVEVKGGRSEDFLPAATAIQLLLTVRALNQNIESVTAILVTTRRVPSELADLLRSANIHVLKLSETGSPVELPAETPPSVLTIAETLRTSAPQNLRAIAASLSEQSSIPRALVAFEEQFTYLPQLRRAVKPIVRRIETGFALLSLLSTVVLGLKLPKVATRSLLALRVVVLALRVAVTILFPALLMAAVGFSLLRMYPLGTTILRGLFD